MKPVLCIIDLSEASVHVLEVAARMAIAYQAPLTILYPYRLLLTDQEGELSKLKMRLEREAIDRFEALKSKVKMLNQVRFDFVPEIGFVYDRIMSYINKSKISGVVMSEKYVGIINEYNPHAFQRLITASKIPFTIAPQIDIEVVTYH